MAGVSAYASKWHEIAPISKPDRAIFTFIFTKVSTLEFQYICCNRLITRNRFKRSVAIFSRSNLNYPSPKTSQKPLVSRPFNYSLRKEKFKNKKSTKKKVYIDTLKTHLSLLLLLPSSSPPPPPLLLLLRCDASRNSSPIHSSLWTRPGYSSLTFAKKLG